MDKCMKDLDMDLEWEGSETLPGFPENLIRSVDITANTKSSCYFCGKEKKRKKL